MTHPFVARSVTLACSLGVLALSACSGAAQTADTGLDTASEGAPDAAADTGIDAAMMRVIGSCAEALSAPEGSPCDFTEVCGDPCAGGAVACSGGRTVRNSFCTGADAGPDVAIDAGACVVRAPIGVTPCRSDGNCSGTFERCRAPDERPSCGICMDPPRDCATDADCPRMDGLDYVCEEAEVSCPCSGDALGTFCTAPCSVTGCDEGWTCASNGHCAADPCDAGYACPLGATCSPSGAGDEHGCVRTTCSSDTDCPCRAGCVEGRCFDVLGFCEALRS